MLNILPLFVCVQCSSVQGSNLVSAPWHRVLFHQPLANSWTLGTKTRAREQRSLVLCLLLLDMSSLGLVVSYKTLFSPAVGIRLFNTQI